MCIVPINMQKTQKTQKLRKFKADFMPKNKKIVFKA